MKINIIYIIIFIFYAIVSFIFVKKDIVLEMEWDSIVTSLIKSGDYKYMGQYSAYMPPVYPYFLFSNYLIFDSNNWLKISVYIQIIIFFISIYIVFKSIFENNVTDRIVVICFLSIIFFPSIFWGITQVSSFALTVSIYSLLFICSYLYVKKRHIKYLFFLVIISIVGLYLRYEYVYFFTFTSFLILLNLKKKKVFLLLPIFFVILIYSPWCYRNYKKLGVITYNTSSTYNLAKGNNINYDIYSTSNIPYDRFRKELLTDSILYQRFNNEISKNNYLKSLFQDYIKMYPYEFIKLNIKKALINLTQYFPNYRNNDKNVKGIMSKIPIAYSLYFSVFTLIFFYVCFKKIKEKGSLTIFTTETFFFQYSLMTFLLFFFMNSFAPLPRYLLFFYPTFIILILKEIFYSSKRV